MTAYSDPATSFLTPTPIWQRAGEAGFGWAAQLPGWYLPPYTLLQLTCLTGQTTFPGAGSVDH